MGGQAGAAAEGAEDLLPADRSCSRTCTLSPPAAECPDLLPRGQGFGVGEDFLVGDHTHFGGGEKLLFGFPEPQRAQAHGVDAEDAGSRMAGDNRRRALGAGGKEAAEKGVHGPEFVGHLVHLAENRREDHLHRLEEREAVAVDQPLQGAVQVLGVAAPRGKGDPEHPGLLPQPGDGVDLAVVAEQAEGLGAHHRREGVGGEAAVADGHRRKEVPAASGPDSSGAGAPGAPWTL